MKIQTVLIFEAMPPHYEMRISTCDKIIFIKDTPDLRFTVAFLCLKYSLWECLCCIYELPMSYPVKEMARCGLSSPAFRDVADAIIDLDFIVECR